MSKEELLKTYNYEINDWIKKLKSMPIEEIAHADYSEPYEINVFHVFELKDGKFATVYECGCSCYTNEDAQIEIFPTKDKAMDKFNEYETEQKKYLQDK